MAGSAQSQTESSSSSHPKALKTLRALRCSFSSSIPASSTSFRIQITMGSSFLLGRQRIIDPLVVNAGQDPREAARDLVQVLERQVALVELPVREDPVDEVLHEAVNPRRLWVRNGPRRRLHRVCEQDERGL